MSTEMALVPDFSGDEYAVPIDLIGVVEGMMVGAGLDKATAKAVAPSLAQQLQQIVLSAHYRDMPDGGGRRRAHPARDRQGNSSEAGRGGPAPLHLTESIRPNPAP